VFYECASFSPHSRIGQLCEDLKKVAGYGIYYDTFEIPNTKRLWLVKNITIMNCNKVLCGLFGVYPSYVAGILNSIKEINLYVLHSENINYAEYVEK